MLERSYLQLSHLMAICQGADKRKTARIEEPPSNRAQFRACANHADEQTQYSESESRFPQKRLYQS
ncbi:hypothetical protein LguiA_023489 [Lonicera macranthoides]